jgi:hypothetical protein
MSHKPRAANPFCRRRNRALQACGRIAVGTCSLIAELFQIALGDCSLGFILIESDPQSCSQSPAILGPSITHSVMPLGCLQTKKLDLHTRLACSCLCDRDDIPHSDVLRICRPLNAASCPGNRLKRDLRLYLTCQMQLDGLKRTASSPLCCSLGTILLPTTSPPEQANAARIGPR